MSSNSFFSDTIYRISSSVSLINTFALYVSFVDLYLFTVSSCFFGWFLTSSNHWNLWLIIFLQYLKILQHRIILLEFWKYICGIFIPFFSCLDLIVSHSNLLNTFTLLIHSSLLFLFVKQTLDTSWMRLVHYINTLVFYRPGNYIICIWGI